MQAEQFSQYQNARLTGLVNTQFANEFLTAQTPGVIDPGQHSISRKYRSVFSKCGPDLLEVEAGIDLPTLEGILNVDAAANLAVGIADILTGYIDPRLAYFEVAGPHISIEGFFKNVGTSMPQAFVHRLALIPLIPRNLPASPAFNRARIS